MPLTLPGEPDRNAGQRFPALVWSLLHVPLFLALFAPGIAAAVRATPEPFRAWLWPTFLPQAAMLALVAWLLAVSAIAGSRVGLYAGLAALTLRFAVAAALALAYSGASVQLLGGATFALSNVLLVLLGWLPGTAKRAWSRPGAEL